MESLLAFYSAAVNTDDGLVHCYGAGCDPAHMNFLGDWITPHGSEGSNDTVHETILFNNCYISYITRLTARISSILGFDDKATKYHAAAEELADAVTRRFANTSNGVYLDTLQTHSLMPLATGVVPAALRNKTMHNLAHQITVTDAGHLDTGLTGTYFLFKYLMEAGRNDLLFAIVNQTTFPSYGYFLAQGYTTWPENWNTTVVHSHHGNHRAIPMSVMHGCYNGVGLWFVEGIAGIRVHTSEVTATSEAHALRRTPLNINRTCLKPPYSCNTNTNSEAHV
jgi:alpha-L-rhamnosidase